MKIFTSPITRLLSFFISVTFVFSGVPVDIQVSKSAKSCLAPWTMASPAGAAVTGIAPGPEATAAIANLQAFIDSTSDGFKNIFRSAGPNLSFTVTQLGSLDIVLPRIGSDSILAGLSQWGLPVGSEYIFFRDSKGVSLYVRIEDSCVRLRQGAEAEIISGDEFGAVAEAARAAVRQDKITVGFDNIRQRKDGCIGVDINIDGNDGQRKIEMRLPLPIVGVLPGSNAEEVLASTVKSVVLMFIANGRVLGVNDTQDIMFAVINALTNSPELSLQVKEIVTVPSLQDAQARETIVAFVSNAQAKGTRFLYNPLTGKWTPLSSNNYRKASSRPEINVSQTDGGVKVAFGQDETLSFTLPIPGLSPAFVKQTLLDIYKNEALVVNDTQSMVQYFYSFVARLDRKYASRVFPMFDDTASFRYRSSADGQDYIVDHAGVVRVADENSPLFPEVKSVKHWVSFIKNFGRVDFSSRKEAVKEMLGKMFFIVGSKNKKLPRSVGKNESQQERKFALPAGPNKSRVVILLLLVAVLCSACSKPGPNVDPTNTPDQPTPSDVTETSEPEQNQNTEQPEVNVEMVTVDLPVVASDNAELISSTGEDGVFHVDFEEDMPSEQSQKNDRPAMPAYIWYFNGSEPESVESVTVEFDLLETETPLDPLTFGYSRGFFVGIHNFDTIPIMPPWVSPDTLANMQTFAEQRGGDTDRDMLLEFPELAVNMQKYIELDGNHVRMVIPYSEFQNASKNLTLQFLPGTTFANLTVQVTCAEGLDINQITQPVESVETDVFHDAVLPVLNADESNMIPESEVEPVNLLGTIYGHDIVNQGLVVNPDGSVNMPVSMYDLGEYADEVQGDYAVVPEGLVAAFMNMKPENVCTDAQRRQVIELALSMIDENGQFAGVYDISQGKVVATERKVSALPALSAMLLYEKEGLISADEIDPIINSIINNQIVRFGNKLYYAPNGIGEDGVMNLSLSDLAINEQLIRFLAEYSVDSNGRLDEKFGASIFLEGFANSMELMLEAQEQNPTKLPSSSVTVTFHQDFSYEIQQSGTFSMDDSYFSMWMMSFDQFSAYLDDFKGSNNEALDSFIKKITPNGEGGYSAAQEEKIREAMAMYAERYDAYRIVNTFYKSCLDIYNFAKTQDSSTIYAAGYNVDTGEMVPDTSVEFSSDFGGMTAFRERFGSTANSANWFNLVGMFNDEARSKEALHLTMINYDMYLSWVMGSGFQNLDYSDPDSFANHGFNVWGNDSLKFLLFHPLPAETNTRFVYGTSGVSFNRENWWEFTLRKLNETRPAEQALTFADMIPFFYENLPMINIVETADNQSVEVVDETDDNAVASVVEDDNNDSNLSNTNSDNITPAAVIGGVNEGVLQTGISNLPVYGPLGLAALVIVGVVIALVFAGKKRKQLAFGVRSAGPRTPEEAEVIIRRGLNALDRAVNGKNSLDWGQYAPQILAGEDISVPGLSDMLETGQPSTMAAGKSLKALIADIGFFKSLELGRDTVKRNNIAYAA